MKPARTPDKSFERELDAAISQIDSQLRAGKLLSDIDLESKYSHLMPELQERSRDLQMILWAERAANSSFGCNEIESTESIQVSALDAALPGYDVSHVIDKGGQGIVFGGVQISTQRDVAIKVVNAGKFTSERRVRRFAREVRLASRLNLPNIVPVFDSGVVESQPYYVMPRIYGMPVDKYAQLHLPTAKQRVELMVKIAEAVSRAHQRGVIHRDLKPTNILVDELNGEPQIVDFGLAKALNADGSEDDENLSMMGHLIGTLPFLSPERATGFESPDVRGDVYALGVLIFVLLTGTYPYDLGKNKEEGRIKIINSKPRSLRVALELSEGVANLKTTELNDDLQAIVSMAIAKDRGERYQGAADFADDLRRYLTGGIVRARIDQRWYLTRQMLRKYKVHAMAAIVVFGMLIWSNIQIRFHESAAKKQRDTARQFADLAEGTLGQVVTEISEEIESLAGGKEVRKRLLVGVSDRIEGLSRLGQSDKSFTSISISLGEKLGDIALAEGRTVAAEQHFIQSATQLASAKGKPSRVDQARLFRKAGIAATSGTAHFEKSIDFAQKALSLNETGAREELARVLVEASGAEFSQGQYESAEMRIEDALRTISDSSDDRFILTQALERDGAIKSRLGDIEGAIESLLQCLNICDDLLELRPFDVSLKERYLVASSRLSNALWVQGKPQEALEHGRTAAELGQYLFRADSGNQVFQRDYVRACNQYASLLRESGDVSRATKVAAVAVLQSQTPLVNEQDDTERLRLTGFSLLERAQCFESARKFAQARDDVLDAIKIRSELVARQPNHLAYRAELAAAHIAASTISDSLFCFEESRSHLERAIDIYHGLVSEQPGLPDNIIDLVMAKVDFAAWHMERRTASDNALAQPHLDEAKMLLEPVISSTRSGDANPMVARILDAIRFNQELLEKRAKEFASS